MGNKEEKTFTDLFSSSNNEPETNTKTFSDLLITNEEETKKNVVEQPKIETPITFDSIFDKLPEEETNSISNNVQETFSQLFDKKEEVKEEITVSNNRNNEEALKLEQEEETPSPNNDNPFFGEIDTFKNNLDNQNIIEEKTAEINTKNEIDFGINPFINSETITENQNQDSQKNANKEVTNPFFEDNSLPNNASQEEPMNTSPFFKEEKKEANPFFENNTLNNEQVTSKEATKENNNPEPSKETISTSPFFEENSLTNNKVTQKEETISTSPFFKEEKKNETNPLFENSISLIENEAPSSKNARIDTSKAKHYNVKVEKKKEPLIKFIIGVLSYALFIWLLLIGVTLLVYVLDIRIRAAKGDYSSPTFNAYVVLTGSMLPEIQVKDVVVTKKLEPSELKEGDVITFASSDSRFLGTIITHRIIKKNYSEKEGYTFQTKGDNNNVADNALVYANNIYGKVILKIPKLGYLQEFLASDGGWIIVILIPCLTVMSYDTVKLIKGIKRKKYKNIKVQK